MTTQPKYVYKKLFMLYSNASSNTLNVDLSSDVDLRTLTLIQYSFDGIPVSSGIPDYLFYNLNFINSPYLVMNNPIRNDNVTGFPLALTGTFTEKTLATGWKVIDHDTKLGKFTIQITKPDKSDAVLTRFMLVFEAEMNSFDNSSIRRLV